MPSMSSRDLLYVRNEFATLPEVCAGRRETPELVRELIRARRLPAPSYVLADGSEMVPADYFSLVDEAGGVDGLEAHFRARHKGEDVDRDWAAYLDGTYGVCLRRVTPENIVRKGQLAAQIEALLLAPAPEDSGWRYELRRAVDELDGLERPFSPDFDRTGFAQVPSRDRLIDLPRTTYAEIWAETGRRSI